MPTQRISLAGGVSGRAVMPGGVIAPTTFTGFLDQYILNAVVVTLANALQRTRTAWVQAYSAGSQLHSGAGSAITTFLGKGSTYIAYSDGGTQIYVHETSLDSRANVGTVADGAIHMSETSIGGTANLVIITSASSGRTYFYPDGGAVTEITDVDFPPKQTPAIAITGNAVHMDGYMFVMTTTGQIWNSDLNSLSAWTAGNYITAGILPDGGIGLERYKNMIVAFGVSTIEFFQNAGNASGSPLSRVPGATINIGAASQHSTCQYLDTVAWIGSIGNGRYGVFMLEGVNAKKISTDIQDANLGPNQGYRLFALMSSGKQYLCIGAGSGSGKYVSAYDAETGLWVYWDVGARVLKAGAAVVNNVFYAATNGIYAMGNSSGDGIPYTIQTAKLDFGTQKRKIINAIRLVGDTTAAATATIKKSDDDYATFATLGTVDLSSQYPRLFRCGSHLGGRAYQIITSTNARLQFMDIDYEVAA